ncbi:MAG: GMC family oxidoreductase, partial [Methylobacteriaceae bacterium]|nr:GMC family oxidoreductase [Methylobacteriaceae bacterium]
GGTVMGHDPATSVTDAHGRVHGVPNIVLSGAGLFAATGGVSPTYTVTALALRSASHIRDNWSAYA